jgi:cytoskeletal protein CcmA (bactofilin family)
MIQSSRLWGLAVGAIASLALTGAQGDDKRVTERDMGSDHIVFGGSLRIDRPVSGDLIAAGGNLDVDAPVSGDAIVAGGNVRLSAAVGQDVYAAGGRIAVDAPIGHNLRIGAGQVDLGPKGSVAGNVSIAGGQVTLRGPVKGVVQVGGGRVLIDGPVQGDVLAGAGQIELGPNARLAGALRYRSGNELRRDPAAQVAGAVERMSLPGIGRDGSARSERIARAPFGGGAAWLWTLGLMVLAAVLVGGLPLSSRLVAQAWRARPGQSLLFGFIALVCIPVAALILLVSIIGIPLALLTLLLYGVLLLVGYVASGVALGEWALTRLRADAAGRTGWRIAAAMLAVLALALLGAVPYVGAVVALFAVLAGIGAIVLRFMPARWSSAPAQSARV